MSSSSWSLIKAPRGIFIFLLDLCNEGLQLSANFQSSLGLWVLKNAPAKTALKVAFLGAEWLPVRHAKPEFVAERVPENPRKFRMVVIARKVSFRQACMKSAGHDC